MTTAQLGPPPVAASRGGSAPSGSRGAGDSAQGHLVESDDGGFTAVLDRRSAPPASDAAPQAQNPDAAGPSGELPSEDVADVDASPVTTALAADVAAVIAAAVVVAAPAAVEAIPVAATPTGTAAATGSVTATATPGTTPAAPAPLPPGVVPALVDGDGSVAPAPPAAVAGTAGDAAPATGTTPAATTPAAPAGPAPAAQLTLTLSRIDPALADGAAATPVATPVATDDAPAPAPATAPRPVAQDVAAAAPKAAEAPAGLVAAPPATNGPATPQAGPLDGLTRAGGLTTAHELARELGHRVQMAVREGGRELLINLRPPDLGHLTIRVTMTDGVMQAQIIADRPEAARLLQQSLAHLDSSLGDLGYSLDSLDVAYSGQDPRDAQASSRGTGAGGDDPTGSDGEAAGPSTPPAVAGDPGRLDLLA